MQPTLRTPTAADQLHRLLILEAEVLAACELVPNEVPPGTSPFDCVAELLFAAIDEGDLFLLRRLTAALEFAFVVHRRRDDSNLAGVVAEAEMLVARVVAPALEVVRG